MNSNTKFFIGLILVIAVFSALSEVIYSFLGFGATKQTEILPPSQILPAEFDVDTVKSITDRSDKYLIIKPQQFEDGKN